MGSFALYIVSLASALTAGYFISPLSQGMSAQPFAPHLITSTEATELQKLNQPRYGTHPDYLAAIKELETIFSDKEGRVSTDKEDLEAHGISDWSYHEAKMPTVVVWAESTDEVKKVVDIARKYKVPITPFSGGTSLEGHFSSPYGGISLDLSLMDKVLHVSEADGDCIVQSGVKWEDVNAYLADKGIKMFFPLDPGPGATIGGMVGTGCSGTNAVRYGTAKAEWFLNLVRYTRPSATPLANMLTYRRSFCLRAKSSKRVSVLASLAPDGTRLSCLSVQKVL
jgi:D-lactate dehydrogenase (cytochrome)